MLSFSHLQIIANPQLQAVPFPTASSTIRTRLLRLAVLRAFGKMHPPTSVLHSAVLFEASGQLDRALLLKKVDEIMRDLESAAGGAGRAGAHLIVARLGLQAVDLGLEMDEGVCEKDGGDALVAPVDEEC
jgi:hypothetical protein